MTKEKIKLAVIGTVGVPAKYGGFETLVQHLVIHLNKRFDITVYCSTKAYKEEEQVSNWKGAKLEYIPLKANGIQSIPYDLISIIKAMRKSDVLLILGVSACLFLPFIKLFSSKKIIVNIDGLEWRRPKWNWFVKRFLQLSEGIACRYADEIVTDNQILKEYVKIRYQIDGKLIEYGADHNSAVAKNQEDVNKYPFINSKYCFKVARIEPENNLDIILEAFAKTPKETLVIVGNWDNSLYGQNLKLKYNQCENIYLFDPIYEPKELNLLRSNAHYYVHGHSAGGTNPSLVEAMYLGLPILSFDVIYNRVTTNNQAAFFKDEKSLEELLKMIDKIPLRTIARNLKNYADDVYVWKNISTRYGNLVAGEVERKVVPVALDTYVPFVLKEEVKKEASIPSIPPVPVNLPKVKTRKEEIKI